MKKKTQDTQPENDVRQDDAGQEPAQSDPTNPAGDVNQPDALQKITEECNDLRDKLLRAQAECANISKRLTQQHQQAMRTAGLELARALLPVLDNLERTVDAGADATDPKVITDGVKLVRDEFTKVFKEFGIAPVDCIGQSFNPMRHEALFQDFESPEPAGTVTQELQRGFMMHERVLRPAKVAVSADKPEEAASENDAVPSEQNTSAES